MFVCDLTHAVTRMSVDSTKQDYSTENNSPWKQLQYTEEGQRMVVIEFKFESIQKKNFQLKLGKCGRFLYLKNLCQRSILTRIAYLKLKQATLTSTRIQLELCVY